MPSGGSWDLRSHVDHLDEHGLLLTIDAATDPDTEVSALMEQIAQRGQAARFTRVGESPTPVVYNVLGTREMVARALSVAPADVPDEFARGRANPIAAVTGSAPAPSQENVLTGDAADLAVLPTIVHSEFDDGRYITAGMVLTADPETGARNVSFNRICPVGPREAAIRMMAPQHLGVLHAKAEARGEELPIAVAIGMHPTASLGGATSPPLGHDELSIVGGLRRQPVDLVPGVTIPLDVPAEAEFVIEAYVECGVRKPEGPFGDFLQYYVPEMDNHRFRVTAITHRNEPIYQTMHAGSAEDVQVLGVSREVDVLEAVRQSGANVTGVRLHPTILGAVVAIRPRFAGEAKAVGMAALGAYRWLKYVVVVDDDVAIADSDDVWWAVATRTRLDDDVIVVPKSGGFPRDEGGMHDARLIVDATAPAGMDDHFRRRRPPGHRSIRLEDFLDDRTT